MKRKKLINLFSGSTVSSDRFVSAPNRDRISPFLTLFLLATDPPRWRIPGVWAPSKSIASIEKMWFTRPPSDPKIPDFADKRHQWSQRNDATSSHHGQQVWYLCGEFWWHILRLYILEPLRVKTFKCPFWADSSPLTRKDATSKTSGHLQPMATTSIHQSCVSSAIKSNLPWSQDEANWQLGWLYLNLPQNQTGGKLTI